RAPPRLAVLDGHRPGRPFRHDLDGAAVEPRDPHPDQPIARAEEDRLHDRRHAGSDALLHDETRLGVGLQRIDRLRHSPARSTTLSLISTRFARALWGRSATKPQSPISVTKKSGSRGNPLSKTDR